MTCSTTRSHLYHALSAICFTGYWIALNTICSHTCSSLSSSIVDSNSFAIFINAVHHHATIPSSTAALVALRASSILYFLFFISISVAAHTLMTATHHTSLARRSSNFSLSYVELVFGSCALI